MSNEKRVFLIVLDSMGIGELPDACRWNDEGSNTLGSIRNHPAFDCPHLKKFGLFHIEGVGGGEGRPLASYARLAERSLGKDTTIGHWEIAGLVSERPLPTYPEGFPEEVISAFEKVTGRKTLCNKPYSGTDVIRDYGKEHMETGALIVYTSADSVFQIAAHEDVVPVPELYRYCEAARKILQGKHGVGRVIARPFTGEWPFTRTPNRHDYSLLPPGDTMLDVLTQNGYDMISVGKIEDIFAGRGVTEWNRIQGNRDGMEKTIAIADRDFRGLCFVNLVDFDMKYGHRNDIEGYARAMTEFDVQLGELIPKLRENDILMITADHGCDPGTPSTDHSREYVPLLIYGNRVRAGVDLKTRSSFADISATVLDYFGLPKGGTAGNSFLPEVLIPDDAELMRMAEAARRNSYCPYSRFSVGAALLSSDGVVYTGCNIESATFTPTSCAERTALFKAVSEGCRSFAKIAISGGKDGEAGQFCAPCGVCRQMLSEFCGPDLPVLLGTREEFAAYPLGSLLPHYFPKDELLDQPET
ncbi:MAG: phosphopentomutase [Clostridia bacterium]|nr:phosphopentomutase [Clostridia bacterium]